jgi:hypothetical protein
VLDEAPSESDLAMPIPDGAVANLVARDLGLSGKTPEDAVAAVRAYFRDNFRYSLYRPAPEGEVSALEDFLRRSRAGHCEYFATATVLLLRAAGIPARYATGYSVQEWSPIEGELEGQQASLWQPLSDLFAWGGHAFNRWRYGERRGGVTSWLGWLLIPLTLILVWRLFFRRRQRRGDVGRDVEEAVRPRVGTDSEFYAVEARLTALGLGRRPAEPPTVWLDRVRDLPPVVQSRAELELLVALHYRYRFDPAGLAPAERARLRAEAQAWLEAIRDLEVVLPSSVSPGKGGPA